MPEIIFDCSCISNFSLSDSLFILKNLYGNSANITEFVSAEIMKGIQQGYSDLERTQHTVKEGWLKGIVLKTKKEKALFEKLSVSLGLGEASSIAVAKTKKMLFACDDKTARREAELLEVKLTGTLGILRKAKQIELITFREGNLILAEMKAKGFYSPVDSLN